LQTSDVEYPGERIRLLAADLSYSVHEIFRGATTHFDGAIARDLICVEIS
jgi:hypothetical protein